MITVQNWWVKDGHYRIPRIFGMWTVLYWTRSSRTQFGVSTFHGAPNVRRLAEDTLNITWNFLYCNHQVHRDFLITLYKVVCDCIIYIYIFIYYILAYIQQKGDVSLDKKKSVYLFLAYIKRKLPETRKTRFWSCEYIAPYLCVFGDDSTRKYDRTCNISRRINTFIILNSQKNPTRCNRVSKFFYFIFIWSSTCFGRHTAHHQESKTAPAASGFAYVEGCWT